MKKILIVDNSEVIIHAFVELFSKHNYFKVYTAKSFEDVENLTLNHNFFVVISNMVLPDALNGELIQHFNQHNIPTIILTSNIDKSLRNQFQKSNVVDYVLKGSFEKLNYIYHLVELLKYIQNSEVLIIDDSKVVQKNISKIMNSLMLQTHCVNNGVDALECLKEHPNISMIITDFNMPKMNGMEFVQKVKKLEEFYHIPILMISTENSVENKIDFYKLGVNDFIEKPILDEELRAKVLNVFFNDMQMSEVRSLNKAFDKYVISSSTDTRGIIHFASEAFCKISGYSKEELIGHPHSIVRHPDMDKKVYETMWETIQSGHVWKGELKNLTKNNEPYWVDVVIEPQFNKSGKIIGYFAVREDITDKKKIYELSITDALTSLYNRRYFNDVALKYISRALSQKRFVAFILLDIDNFKKYNDTYGHQKGDNVLKEVSQALIESFKRDNDLTFRLGGEEFGILVTTTHEKDIQTLCELARSNIEQLSIEHEKNQHFGVITASFGLCMIKNESIDVDKIYQLSDEALYESKRMGRNQITQNKY